MLYDLLGDELFDVFHDYFETYGGESGMTNIATLEDFINIVNQHEDEDLGWFFDA